jgi:hypothetical protein
MRNIKQGAITRYLNALSLHAPHRKTSVLLSMLPCPHAGRATPFPGRVRVVKISQLAIEWHKQAVKIQNLTQIKSGPLRGRFLFISYSSL